MVLSGFHYIFCHGGATDVAVADEKHSNHCCITSHFFVLLGISGFVSPCKKSLSIINWCVMAYVNL